jgi:hypothetical protein
MSNYSLSNESETDNVYSQTSIDDGYDDPDTTTDEETLIPKRFPKHSKHPKRFCFRCGRTGHFAGSCYAKTHLDGTRLPRGRLSESNPSPAKKQRPTPGIYALQDPTGCIYVGKSNDRAARIRQHRAGQGTTLGNSLNSLSIPTVQSTTSSPGSATKLSAPCISRASTRSAAGSSPPLPSLQSKNATHSNKSARNSTSAASAAGTHTLPMSAGPRLWPTGRSKYDLGVLFRVLRHCQIQRIFAVTHLALHPQSQYHTHCQHWIHRLQTDIHTNADP